MTPGAQQSKAYALRSTGSCKLLGTAGPGWGPRGGPWARGAPTSGRQQREAAEQQQRQRDGARRRGALHGAGRLERRTKARRAAAARSGLAWAAKREAPARRVQLSRPEEARRGRGPRGPSLQPCAMGARRRPDSPAGTYSGRLSVRLAPPPT